MSNLLDRNYIVCCTRADSGSLKQPPYLHQCACPFVNLNYKNFRQSASLIGFREFIDSENGILPSVPPRKYRHREATIDSMIYQDYACCGNGEDPEEFSLRSLGFVNFDGGLEYSYYDVNGDFTESGNQQGSYQKQQGCDSELSVPFNKSIVTLEYDDTESELKISDTVINGVTHPWSGDNVFSAASTTTAWYKQGQLFSRNSFICEDTAGYDGFIHKTTLSEEDTEDDALLRAPVNESTGVNTSLWEVRTDDFSFTKRTSSYYAIASNLQIGAIYVFRIMIERRPAIKNPQGEGYVEENGDPALWSTKNEDGLHMLEEIEFTASTNTMLVPGKGTWVDGNSDGEVSGDEVTNLVALPHVKGWEYRVAAGYPEIELAL